MFRLPLWPMWLVRNEQLVRFHTLMSLSQPHDAMMGLAVSGEKRTLDTHSVWIEMFAGVFPAPSRAFCWRACVAER